MAFENRWAIIGRPYGTNKFAPGELSAPHKATQWHVGQSAEDIAQCYPYLTLSQIYTALAYFHANRGEIESELAALDADFDELKHRLA